MGIKLFIEDVKLGNLNIENHTAEIIEKTKKIDEEFNYCVEISEDLALQQSRELDKQIKNGSYKGQLLGFPLTVKDCICVKGVQTRNTSRILDGYKPVIDATAVSRVKNQGGIIIAKTTNDAWGFGSFNVNVGLDFKIPKNPINKDRTTGGSAGGSCGFTKKAGFHTASIAESTGGSIACPASFCGVVGLTPTYGRVSRYGLLDYGNSLDKIGPVATSCEDAGILLSIIAGLDPSDATCSNESVPDLSSSSGSVEGKRIGVVKQAFSEGVDSAVSDSVWKVIKKLESHGATYKEIDLPLSFKYGLSVYYLLAMSEASTNLARYCGMRYGVSDELIGSFNEYFSKVRSKHFCEEAKRRILIGTYARMAGFRDAYYIKAAKIRTLIVEEYKKVFKDVGSLISPTMPVIAPRFSDIEKMSPLQNYMMDILTAAPNLAGLPHVSIPSGDKSGMPIGTMVIGDHFKEKEILDIGSNIES